MPVTRTRRARGYVRRAASWMVAAAFAACGGDGGGTTNPQTGSIRVTVAGSPATIEQGHGTTLNVAVARTAPFAGPVTLTVEGAPAGMTASFAPASVAAGATASVLSLDVESSVAAATYPLTIRAKGQGVSDATAALSVVVTAPATPAFGMTLNPTALSIAAGASGSTTATVTRSGGFGGAVALAVTGAPAGVTTSVTPSPVTGGTATINVAVGAATVPGTYNLTVTGTGTGVANQTATIALTVTAPQSFSMALSPTSVSMAQGANATTTATITRAGGFTGPVALAVTGAPAGVTTAIATSPVAGNTATITVSASATAAPGTYSLTVTGTGTGVANKTATLSVTVTAASTGAFTLVLAPSTLSVAQGANGTTTATITRSGGFTGAVDLTVTGAPSGVTVTLNPGSITTGTTSTITLAVGASVPVGTYTLTVTGTGSGVATKTATLTLTVTVPQSITLALSPTALSVAQGASGTTTATIARVGGFTGAVGIAVTGAPAGVTVTPNPSSITTGTTSTITVAVGASVTPGTYTLTVTGTGTGITNKTATLTLTVTASSTGAFTLALSPTTVSVAQGASATTTATIARSGGFAGAVNLALTGAPAGLTVTLNPASVTGTSSTITVAASSSLAAGTYTVTVTGSGTGVTNKTATLTVNVTAGSQQTATYAFCADNVPTWFAVQNGPGAAWTRVTPSGTSFTFHFTASKVGIAYVTTSTTNGSDLTVLYATASEVQGTGGTTNVECTTGGKTVYGSVANVGTTEFATIALGPATTSVYGATGVNTFTLTDVPSGAHDLIAGRGVQTISGSSFTTTLNRLIIRRGLDPAALSTLPVLDFGSSESFAPATANLTIGNLGSDQAMVSVGLTTANGTSASFFSSSATTATTPYYGVPDAHLASGDLHEVTAIAFPGGSATTSRFAVQYFRSVANRTVTLGPTLGAPTITTVATSPYLRLRAQLTSHAEYNRLGGIFYSQGTGGTARSVSVLMTAAYAGGAAYDLTIPDLSGVSGWSNAWGLQAGVSTDWTEIESGGTFNYFFPGARPSDGSSILFATRTGTITSP